MIKTMNALQNKRKKQDENKAGDYFIHRLIGAYAKTFEEEIIANVQQQKQVNNQRKPVSLYFSCFNFCH
jgi:hypothetical protein